MKIALDFVENASESENTDNDEVSLYLDDLSGSSDSESLQDSLTHLQDSKSGQDSSSVQSSKKSSNSFGSSISSSFHSSGRGLFDSVKQGVKSSIKLSGKHIAGKKHNGSIPKNLYCELEENHGSGDLATVFEKASKEIDDYNLEAQTMLNSSSEHTWATTISEITHGCDHSFADEEQEDENRSRKAEQNQKSPVILKTVRGSSTARDHIQLKMRDARTPGKGRKKAATPSRLTESCPNFYGIPGTPTRKPKKSERHLSGHDSFNLSPLTPVLRSGSGKKCAAYFPDFDMSLQSMPNPFELSSSLDIHETPSSPQKRVHPRRPNARRPSRRTSGQENAKSLEDSFRSKSSIKNDFDVTQHQRSPRRRVDPNLILGRIMTPRSASPHRAIADRNTTRVDLGRISLPIQTPESSNKVSPFQRSRERVQFDFNPKDLNLMKETVKKDPRARSARARIVKPLIEDKKNDSILPQMRSMSDASASLQFYLESKGKHT